MKSKKRTIRGYQKIHAKQRCLERFGIALSSDDYEGLCIRIKSDNANLVKTLSRTRLIYNMEYNGMDIFVLWNAKTGRIVTFLTVEQVARKKGIE